MDPDRDDDCRRQPVRSATPADHVHRADEPRYLSVDSRVRRVRATALRGACWFQATFLVAFAGMLATPDSPTVLFWALTLMLTARAVRTGRLVSWILAGATVGLALLSKYSALFLPLGMVIWAAADRSRRSLFARPGPWLAAAVASLIFSVNIAWNAHDWMTFAKQFGRAVPTTGSR
ncbi:MAG: glycosyltransferase family 39 protein [Oceanicaulis sp.]|nr:glycosyltransferase family 39 protein [Oceanicaulis sp.]